MALRDNNCDRFNSHQNPIACYRSSHEIPCLNWNSLEGPIFQLHYYVKGELRSNTSLASSFRCTISVTVTTQSITVSCRGSSHCWGCTSQCIASENLLITSPTNRKSSSALFVLHRCTWGRTPDRHLYLHFACLYPDSTWFEYLPPGAVVSWDTIPCLMNHIWNREKSAELKKLSNPPNLWQMSLIHRFLEFVISFSWKMQQRIQLKWIPDNNWWQIFWHGSIPNSFYMPRICSWFLGKLHQTEDDDGGGFPNPPKPPWDAGGSSIFISVVWSVARYMPNTWHSWPKVYKVMLVKTQLLHFALVRISCRTRCLKQRTAGSGIFQTRKGSKLKNRSVLNLIKFGNSDFCERFQEIRGLFPG